MAIDFVGAGAQAASNTLDATVPAAWPSGYTAVAGDVAILIGAGRPNSTATPATPSGYYLVDAVLREVGTYDLRLVVFVKVLTDGESAPGLVVPAAYSPSGTTGGLSAQVAVFSGVDNTTQEDVTAVSSASAAASTWTPLGPTTETDGAWVLSVVASADDNSLALSSAQGFTLQMGGADYDTTIGSDHAVGLATLLVATAGTPTMPTWQQTVLSSDAWVGSSVVLRPAAGSGGGSIVPILNSYAMRRR